jgi:hypothetical protein
MLMAEAQWIGRTLGQLDAEDLSPLLNVGSATATFREVVQPWIDREIVAPLVRRGVAIHHLDIQEGDGIDLRGDLTDDTFVAELGSYGYKALLCCNLLEHVLAPSSICRKLELLVPVGGYLLITVPNRFPYHPDPIDTMFRPEVDELVQLFPRCCLVKGDVLDCGTGWDYVNRNPVALISKVIRRLAGLSEHGGMKGSASFLPWLFREFRQSCALLQRTP